MLIFAIVTLNPFIGNQLIANYYQPIVVVSVILPRKTKIKMLLLSAFSNQFIKDCI